MKILILIVLLTSSLSLFATEAIITRVHGEAKIHGVRVVRGQKIKEDEEVIVMGSKSHIQLRLSDGSRLLLREGSLKIDKSNKRENILSVLRGALFVEKAKTDVPLKLHTANAVLGGRGTKFYVQETEGETYLCVCEGVVEVENTKSKVFVEKNEDVRVRTDQPFAKQQAPQNMQSLSNSGLKEME